MNLAKLEYVLIYIYLFTTYLFIHIYYTLTKTMEAYLWFYFMNNGVCRWPSFLAMVCPPVVLSHAHTAVSQALRRRY